MAQTQVKTGNIADNTVGLADLLQVATGTLLGRTTAGTGNVEVLTAVPAAVLGAGGANPSASVALAAVNGSANTFMRSDAAPALSQAIAPTWTAVHTYRQTIGATSTDGIVIDNTTAAANNAQQWSPRLRLTGRGWSTADVGSSTVVDWIVENQPVQGVDATTQLVISHQLAAGGYTADVTIKPSGSTFATPCTFSDATDSTSSTTGALKTTGGLGVAKAFNVGTNAGIGTANVAKQGLVVLMAAANAGAGVYGIVVYGVATGTTGNVTGVFAQAQTTAASFTLTSAYTFYAANPSKGATSTITTAYGLYVENIAAGATNYAIFTSGAAQVSLGGAFGCNGATPRTAFASGGAAPAGGTGATAGAYDTAAHRDALITLVNNIRTALVNNGIMS